MTVTKQQKLTAFCYQKRRREQKKEEKRGMKVQRRFNEKKDRERRKIKGIPRKKERLS